MALEERDGVGEVDRCGAGVHEVVETGGDEFEEVIFGFGVWKGNVNTCS